MKSYLQVLQETESTVQRNELFRSLVHQLDKDLYSGTGGRVSLTDADRVTVETIRTHLLGCVKTVLKLPGSGGSDYLYRVDVSEKLIDASPEEITEAILNRTTQKVVFRKRYSNG